MRSTPCPSCDTPLLLGQQDNPLCRECLAVLSPEQLQTYRGAVQRVYRAPAGRFAFFSRQLEMVVEDLADAIRALRGAA